LSFPPGTALALPPIFLIEKMAIRKGVSKARLFCCALWCGQKLIGPQKNQAQTYLWLKTWSKPWQSVLHGWATQIKKAESVILVTLSKDSETKSSEALQTREVSCFVQMRPPVPRPLG